ncbi:MAG: amidophosphoribosyltransferase [Nanoarchaeota archaeon]|nr:amidophosphoribosyltransferase [Nanoarchaeota archaeon]
MGELKEECGVFGVYNHKDAVALAHRGIRGLQHRGEESWGQASLDDGVISIFTAMGLISTKAPQLHGNSSICHTRYSTEGSSHISNAQPFGVADEVTEIFTSEPGILHTEFRGNPVAVAHNGNLTGGLEGVCAQGSDTKKLITMIGSSENPVQAITAALKTVEGAYSLVFLTQDMMIAARDPSGYRPLTLGTMGHGWILSSETAAIKDIGGQVLRDIAAGEMFAITPTGFLGTSIGQSRLSECIFELVYLARQDSIVFGQSVYQYRHKAGKELAKENRQDRADLVTSLPSAGDIYAIGYSQESGIPFEPVIFRNHYFPGRSFIKPTQMEREHTIDDKLRVVTEAVYGRSVIVIDDSVVSGTNIKNAVIKLKMAGAKEIHLRIASPPYLHPCYWGVDTPSVDRFIAYQRDIYQIQKTLGVDSISYLSMEGMLKHVFRPYDKCTKCFR